MGEYVFLNWEWSIKRLPTKQTYSHLFTIPATLLKNTRVRSQGLIWQFGTRGLRGHLKLDEM